MKTAIISLNVMWVCLLVLGLPEPIFGQTDEHYAHSDGSSQGYWKLKTDYTIHGTLVRFYDSDSQLVYQESLPNQFIKLTPKNIRRLDQALTQLMANQLVGSRIRTTELPYLYPVERKTPETTRAALHVDYYTPTGVPAIHVIVKAPTRERVYLSIEADNGLPVYEHTNQQSDSRHHLNFQGLQPGLYTVRVKCHTEESQQQVLLSYEKQQAVVRFPDAAKSNLSLSQVLQKFPIP